MMTFKQFQTIFNEKLDAEKLTIAKRQPQALYEPVNYTLEMGGKRLRPILMLLAYDLYKDNYQDVLDPALAIEVFHNFTLLHDDIMDDADVRRNKPSVHIKYSQNVGILSGDAMSILSFEILSRISEKYYREVHELFTRTSLSICEGQQYDTDFEERNDVAVDEYLEMIRLKTAVLLACSLKIGAIIGDASKESAQLLYDFGIDLGMTFQLQDDYLDTFGNVQTFGKEIGGDIVSNKKTFLMLKALELANEDQKKELEHWLTINDFDKAEKIAAVQKLYIETGAKNASEIKMKEYLDQSLATLDQIDVFNEKKTELKALAQKLLIRES